MRAVQFNTKSFQKCCNDPTTIRVHEEEEKKKRVGTQSFHTQQNIDFKSTLIFFSRSQRNTWYSEFTLTNEDF